MTPLPRSHTTPAPRPERARAPLVVLRGGGDLGTGVAHALSEEGYRVVVLETARPTAVRRTVAFAEAVRGGEVVVEGVTARLATPGEIERGGWPGWVPVLIDPDGETLGVLRPDVIIDARMEKRNVDTRRRDAGLTIGLGPGFEAGRDVDLVIETARGPSLGRVIKSGSALPNTGVPAPIEGATVERVLRSPADGAFRAAGAIGDQVNAGDVVGTVEGVPVRSRIAGLLRGLAADGAVVCRGDKIGDVDPRGRAVDPRAMSDKARAVGAAVLEALRSSGIGPGQGHVSGGAAERSRREGP
jgi:xanthine dehydrogenase accessory factor